MVDEIARAIGVVRDGALNLIGYWDDRPIGTWIMPGFLIDETWGSEERERVAAYLRGGTLVHQQMGFSRCRLANGISSSLMGSAERTDGLWLWPEGLWIYVEEFGVRLPCEFLEHVRGCGFVPDNPPYDDVSSKVVETGFWRQWCDETKRESGWLRYASVAMFRTWVAKRRTVLLRSSGA